MSTPLNLDLHTIDARAIGADLVKQLQDLCLQLNDDPTIHPTFHNDIAAIIRGATQLSQQLLAPNIPHSALLQSMALLLHACGTIADHAVRTQEGLQVYIIQSNNQIYSVEMDSVVAEAKAKTLAQITGAMFSVSVAALVSTSSPRPSIPTPQLGV